MSMARRTLHERDRPFTWLHLKLGPERNIPPSLPFYLFFHPLFFRFCIRSFFLYPLANLLFLFYSGRQPIRNWSDLNWRARNCLSRKRMLWRDAKRGPSSRGNERKRSHLAVRIWPETCHLRWTRHRHFVITFELRTFI